VKKNGVSWGSTGNFFESVNGKSKNPSEGGEGGECVTKTKEKTLVQTVIQCERGERLEALVIRRKDK